MSDFNIQASLPLSSLLRKAQRHVKAEEFALATILYREALLRFPKNKTALKEYKNLKGLIALQNVSNSQLTQEQVQELIGLYEQGKFEEVLSRSKSLIHLFPEVIVLYNLQGASFAAMNMLDEAIISYKKAINIDPDYADSYNNLSAAQCKKGNFKAAIVSSKQALKLKPNYPEAYNNLGIALKDKGDLDTA